MVSSIHELANSTIIIYPNPATDVINIDVDGLLDFTITLYDSQGKRIKISNNSSQIRIETVPSGNYLLEIIDLETGQKIIEKIVIGR